MTRRRRGEPGLDAFAARARPIALAVLACLAGCAQIEAPRGGPEDKEPPRVVETWPDSGAVQVPLGDSLAHVFSEPVDRSSVEDAFFLSPPQPLRERRWRSSTWILRLEEPLRPGVTYAGLLGAKARDRHGIALAKPWSYVFSTGDSIDDGRVEGRVIGQRYPGKEAFLYVWPWESAPPDTTSEELPADPLRLGQADGEGTYELVCLPRGRPLRICALYDREQNRRFDPGSDRWSCTELATVVPDTGAAVRGLDLYFSDPDEPGTVSGTVVDSACIGSKAGSELLRVRAKRDSLRTWLSSSADTTAMTADDSLRIGRELLRLDSLQTAAAAESADCARPLVAQLLAGDTAMVRESKGATFAWKDVPPGIYRLRGFRDANANGRPDSTDVLGRFPHALEVLPLRVLKDLEIVLPRPTRAGEPAEEKPNGEKPNGESPDGETPEGAGP